jgi:hypothetical protein
MIAYVDPSVLLRVALRQADALREWRQINRGASSVLARVVATAARAHGFRVVGTP